MNLTPEQKSIVIGIAQEIVSLGETQGWKHFVQAAESFANSQLPRVDHVKGQEHAIEIASRAAFASGIRACVGLMQQKREELNSLTK